MANTRVQFVDVMRCGYHLRGQKKPALYPFADLLPKVTAWADVFDSRLETALSVGYGESLSKRATLLDWAEEGGDYLLTMWVDGEQEDNKVFSLTVDSDGVASVATTAFDDSDMIGFPAYIWAVPEHSLAASIRLEKCPNGMNPWGRYMKRWLQLAPPDGTFIRESDADHYHVGIVVDGETVPGIPQFDTVPAVDQTVIAQVRRSVKQITSVEQRINLAINSPTTRGIKKLLGRFFFHFDPDVPQRERAKRWKLQFRLPYTPTLEELNEMIEEFSGVTDRWSDVGFRIRGIPRELWINKGRAIESVDLGLSPPTTGLYAAEDVLAAIRPHRIKLLAGAKS